MPAPTDPGKARPRVPPVSDQADGATGATDPQAVRQDDHEGATEDEVGDRTGPAAGYDQEPDQEKDTGGVS